ncbi:MAG: flagellar biosynthesis protein FliQ [Armatimonadia bacterium]|nr:flagellar biosynthesis protein FliQ [Armatimonadia bacterium]
MTELTVMEIGRNAMMTTLLLSAPALGFALAAGLIIAIFQAATQIQEMTLAFVPKILAVMVAAILFGPWMMRLVIRFTIETWGIIPNLGE